MLWLFLTALATVAYCDPLHNEGVCPEFFSVNCPHMCLQGWETDTEGCNTCQCASHMPEDIYEGDIKLSEEQKEVLLGNGTRGANIWDSWKWVKDEDENKVYIAYEMNNNDPKSRESLAEAFRLYRENTCIRFVPRTVEVDYIDIQYIQGCYCYLGRGSPTLMSLTNDCYNDVTDAFHELMHAVGFFHEHTRPDRDDYVTINWDNMWGGSQDANFGIEHGIDSFGSYYDYRSIMHYESYGFSKEPGVLPVITKKNGSIIRRNLQPTSNDYWQINRMYNC